MKPVKAKKSLGQNFLRDENIIEEIFTVADVHKTDWIFEIGPGTGALTLPLFSRIENYLAIEIDHSLADRLTTQFRDSKKVSIVEGDILRMNLEELLTTTGFATHSYKIIANIPYYITAPIIRTLLSLKAQPQSLTLMVQDEVAERLAAKPGSMSLLSIMAQYSASVEKKLFVPRESFEPVPKVDSAVVLIVPKRQYDPVAERKVFRLARAGFSARRKTLANNLSNALHVPREEIEERLQSVGLAPLVRAQEVSVEQWEALAKIM